MVSPPVLNAIESENCRLDHVINNCQSGIKIQPENMTICFESCHEIISHRTAKKKYSEVFWVGDNFPKILQFYSNFARGITEIWQKMFFTNFSPYFISIDCINMVFRVQNRHAAPLPGGPVLSQGPPSSWRQAQTQYPWASFELRSDVDTYITLPLLLFPSLQTLCTK